MILQEEINLIKGNGRLRLSATKCISEREEMLKIYPSSLGGKYHPPDERSAGGLVKHIKRMVYLLHELTPHFDLSEEEHDILIYCALFHDLSNIDISEVVDGIITRDKRMYKMWHGCLSARLAVEHLCDDPDGENIHIIQGIIRSHTGAWLPNNRQPSSKLEIIFSTIDFIVSRENVLVKV